MWYSDRLCIEVSVVDIRSQPIFKYPRTPHLEGSNLQEGDEDLARIPYRDLVGRFIVVEEKLDAANAGVSFDSQALLRLQSRGHYLMGGWRERQFAIFKQWAQVHEDALFDRLTDRFVLYGEWMAAKHTVFYDCLPHYFQEFDILDTQTGQFLDTATRHTFLSGSPVQSVPVLYQGIAPRTLAELTALIRPSLAKTAQWQAALIHTAQRRDLNVDRIMAETEQSILAEGLYIKVEDKGQVVQRLKWVRADFVQAILAHDDDWHNRPIVPNQLHPLVDLYAAVPTVSWADLAKDRQAEEISRSASDHAIEEIPKQRAKE